MHRYIKTFVYNRKRLRYSLYMLRKWDIYDPHTLFPEWTRRVPFHRASDKNLDFMSKEYMNINFRKVP